MSKRPIRDKLLGEKDEEHEGFEHLRNATIKALKGILAAIKKNYQVKMNITCKIVGVGTVATFEYLKKEIEADQEEETESSRKIVEMLEQRIEKAKERLIKLIEAKNLTNLTLTASMEKIPYISWITDVSIEVIIKLIA